MHVLQRFRRSWICVYIWMGYTVAGIPHKPAKKEALRMSRRGPPSDTPCSSLLLHSCNTPRKQKQCRQNGKKWEKKINKSKKPKEVMYWGKKKPKLNEQMASCRQKDRAWKYLPKLLPLRQVPKPFWLELSFPRLGSWLMYSKLSCKLKQGGKPVFLENVINRH